MDDMTTQHSPHTPSQDVFFCTIHETKKKKQNALCKIEVVIQMCVCTRGAHLTAFQCYITPFACHLFKV